MQFHGMPSQRSPLEESSTRRTYRRPATSSAVPVVASASVEQFAAGDALEVLHLVVPTSAELVPVVAAFLIAGGDDVAVPVERFPV